MASVRTFYQHEKAGESLILIINIPNLSDRFLHAGKNPLCSNSCILLTMHKTSIVLYNKKTFLPFFKRTIKFPMIPSISLILITIEYNANKRNFDLNFQSRAQFCTYISQSWLIELFHQIEDIESTYDKT